MKIDGLLTGIPTNVMQVNNETSLLERLHPGDSIKAQILDMKMGEMVLRLADGSTVRAASMVQLQAKPGDMVSFFLKEKVNGKFILETTRQDTAKLETKKPGIESQGLIDESLNQEVISMGAADSIHVQDIAAADKLQKKSSAEYKGLEDNLKKVLQGMNISTDTNEIKLAKFMLDQGLPLNHESFDTIKKLISENPEIAPKKVIFLLANGLELSEENIQMLDRITEGKLKSGDLLQKLANSIEKAMELSNDDELLGKVLDDLKKLPVFLKDTAREATQNNINELKKQIIEKITPENLLPEQLEKLHIIRRHLPSMVSPFRDEIQSIVGELEKSIEFFSEVSKQNYFYQIPLYVNENNATGELYILKNRAGAKRFDKNSLTAYLSLDTENIGVIAAYVNISARIVEIHFRAESNAAVEKIREFTIDLYRAFNEKGYKLADCSCRLKEAGESVNIVDAGEKVKIPWLMKNNPIDIKV